MVQETRELSVLRSIFFNGKIPTDPSEPEYTNIGKEEVKLIPGEDTSEQAEDSVTDYSADGWPEPLDERNMSSGVGGGRNPLGRNNWEGRRRRVLL